MLKKIIQKSFSQSNSHTKLDKFKSMKNVKKIKYITNLIRNKNTIYFRKINRFFKRQIFINPPIAFSSNN